MKNDRETRAKLGGWIGAQVRVHFDQQLDPEDVTLIAVGMRGGRPARLSIGVRTKRDEWRWWPVAGIARVECLDTEIASDQPLRDVPRGSSTVRPMPKEPEEVTVALVHEIARAEAQTVVAKWERANRDAARAAGDARASLDAAAWERAGDARTLTADLDAIAAAKAAKP